MIANVSSSIRMVADRIQQAAVTNIDQLQEQYLPANVTDKRTMTPVNVMAWARYVRGRATHGWLLLPLHAQLCTN